jgi:hypothetical protein
MFQRGGNQTFERNHQIVQGLKVGIAENYQKKPNLLGKTEGSAIKRLSGSEKKNQRKGPQDKQTRARKRIPSKNHSKEKT